ncbi:hypothetical protein [Candidatus Lariskella endosymbiont of Hedychridium roseum]|uniref:hypothetical protein n=1 Tax=Candidatus Lariskella endosymbiont of Hedychridium roseum TaxID=3077949 RepID=UPI0030CE4A03
MLRSAFGRFAPRKVHPDKENGYNDDLVFVKSLEEKFKDDIQVKEIAQRLLHWITTGSKTVDTAVDFARFIYIPTRDNTKKALIGSIKLYGMYFSTNRHFIAINALDVGQHLYTGQYFEAAKSVIMAASFTAIPYIIGLLNMPYITYANLILTTYYGYSAISNMYSLNLEVNSDEGAKKSDNAYNDLSEYYSYFQNFYFNLVIKLTSILDFGVHDESVKEVLVQEATSSVEMI